jgi:hypothetical protein
LNNQNNQTVRLSILKKKKVIVGVMIFFFLIGVVYVGLVRFGIIKDPFPLLSIPFLQKEPKVSIKTEYKNPFDKKTQYVNPFEDYKNPFVVAK